MELFNSISNMRVTDLQDPNILRIKQEQIQASLNKFKKHFVQNLDSLNQKEHIKQVSPKFTVCFMDLATYMGVQLNSVIAGDKKVNDQDSNA